MQVPGADEWHVGPDDLTDGAPDVALDVRIALGNPRAV
jgi:hypothetical protein